MALIHAQLSFPLPVLVSSGQRLSPSSGTTLQGPKSRIEVLENSHPPRSNSQPMADRIWQIHISPPSPFRWCNSEVCTYTGSHQALPSVTCSGNLINKAYFFCLSSFPASFLIPCLRSASNKLLMLVSMSRGLLLR